MSSIEQQQTDAHQAPEAGGDVVHEVVAGVRADLAARRADGSLPHLPEGELDRQFSAVVEAVDAGLVEEPPVDATGLRDLAVLETWRPTTPGLKGRLTRPVAHLLSRVVGALVRRQVDAFSSRTAAVVEQLAERQNRLARFLARAHLDRIRSLEYRVAELERRIEDLQRGDTAPR